MFLNWDGVVNTISVKMIMREEIYKYLDNDKTMSLLAMKAQCEAKHSVVIESLNYQATIWECMLWCALRSMISCASPMVRGLSFLGMSRTCPCFHDCGIHTCPSFQIIINPLTTRGQILSLNSIWRPSMTSDFQIQCHLWWLMKNGFQFTDVLMHSLFSFFTVYARSFE